MTFKLIFNPKSSAKHGILGTGFVNFDKLVKRLYQQFDRILENTKQHQSCIFGEF